MRTVVLVRYAYMPDRTLGHCYIDERRWWTLERPWLLNRRNKSCIPEGRYLAIFTDTPKHGPSLLLQAVPGRTGILFHAGNTPADTQGCILLGNDSAMSDAGPIVINSRAAIDAFNSYFKPGDEAIVHVVTANR